MIHSTIQYLCLQNCVMYCYILFDTETEKSMLEYYIKEVLTSTRNIILRGVGKGV